MQPRRGPRPTPAAAVRPRGPGAASRSGPGSPGPPHAGKRADPPSAVEKGAGRPAPLGGPATPPASLLCSAAGGQDAHWWGEEHARLQRGQTCCPSGKCSAMPPTPTPPLRAQRGPAGARGIQTNGCPPVWVLLLPGQPSQSEQAAQLGGGVRGRASYPGGRGAHMPPLTLPSVCRLGTAELGPPPGRAQPWGSADVEPHSSTASKPAATGRPICD